MIKSLNKKSRVLVATFSPWNEGKRSPTNGMVEPFTQFFSKRVGHFVLIDQPHPGSDTVIPFIEIYKKSKLKSIKKSSLTLLKPFLRSKNAANTSIIFKIRDFLSVLDFVFRDRKKYDLIIGFESINALAGVFLKKIGLVDTVVYFVSDFSPRRYKQKWFNNLYLFLDKLAATYSDATWNVSYAMSEARKNLGYNMGELSPQLYAPNAFFTSEIKYLPVSKIKPVSIMYAGSMGKENGPDLAIKAMTKIIKKIPNATLTLAGWTTKQDEEKLINLIKKLKLENSVEFKGFIPTNYEMLDLVRHHQISIAPYRAIPNSVRWYADAVKIRSSLACGLPVVTTQVPPMGKEAEKLGAGVVVKDNVNDLSEAIINIFLDKKRYLKMRSNAIKAAKNNTWENSYSNALKAMGILI